MSKVIHPNFKIGPGQKNVANRKRAIIFQTTQPVYDAILAEVEAGRAESPQDVLKRALEAYLKPVEPTQDGESPKNP